MKAHENFWHLFLGIALRVLSLLFQFDDLPKLSLNRFSPIDFSHDMQKNVFFKLSNNIKLSSYMYEAFSEMTNIIANLAKRIEK